ncbi:MAG: T9SS C-terminal target domain-containing protein [Bacteroidetes bacterium]|nr:MAG: T9SS C-terminal target domain-containing protein [Bacteroidota bacterium]REK05166.1 MAG: T9SS C-terminal target domain-containing protein [Bacteroidota bacterium]REK32571.1 MAG: T9SS C-terminal target domain-containing protein [Bacteroidota bacterium]REK48982.1 MAG: T9SS C-terminal target domain-containing protein [Bacteroidota bacterium]
MRNNFTKLSLPGFLLACILLSHPAFSQTDAGVTVILPSSPVCAGTQTVQAIVQNYGAVDITSVNVGWEVNGVAQTSASYSGLISAGNSDTVTLGNFNFSSFLSYSIRAYTSNPNGGADANNANDTLTESGIVVRLNGTYTIGGTSPDFANVPNAVAALHSSGICGPVVFNIRAGVDTIQTVINAITGASSTNTITFQSENGDSSSVVLVYASSPDGVPPNYLIRLNGADHLIFRKLTLMRSGIEPYARVIEFTNHATFNTITNCRLVGAVNTVTNSLSAIIYSTTSSATNDSMNTFTNNRIENGSLGIYMNGNGPSSLESDLVISNNTFVNQYSKAMQMSNLANVQIINNQISSSSTYLGYAAMSLAVSQRSQMIARNKISGITGSGIYLEDCSGFNSVPGIVANNFIQVSDSVGISLAGGNYQDIVHNSVHITGSSASSRAFTASGIGTGKIVKNNIFANTGTGYCYVISNHPTSGIDSSNFNNLYHVGTNLGNYNGTNRTSLAQWRSSFQKDSNSVSINPQFISTTDLHATSIAMDNLGNPLANVTTDIDGQTRSLSTPDIGADEYSGVSRDLGVTAVLAPLNNACGENNMEVKVIVTNFGGAVETGFNVTCELSGTLSTTLNGTFSGNLNPGANDTLTFATTVNTSAGGTLNLKSYTNLAFDVNNTNDTISVSRNIIGIPAMPVVMGDSICGPGSANLSASSSDTLRWFAGPSGGSVLGTGSSFNTGNISSTTNFYVSAHNGCPSARVAVVATVLPLPVVNLGNDVTVVSPNSATFNAGVGFSSYLWSPGGQTTPSINVNVQDCYTVTVTDANNCSNSDTACLFVVQPTDVGVSTVLSPANNDCAKTSTIVSVVVRNHGTDPAIGIPVTVNISGLVTASFMDTVPNLAAGDSIIRVLGSINTMGGGTVNVEAITSYNADPNMTNDTLRTSATLVTEPALPVGLGGSRCGSGAIAISAVASATIQWYDAPSGGNLLFTGNTLTIPNLTASTTFYAQNGNTCNNQNRTPVDATIHPLPSVNLGNDTIVTGPITLDAGAGFTSYNWSTGATTQTIVAGVSDTYIVTVQDANGCFNSDTIVVTISVGLNEISNIQVMAVYPNPAENEVFIEISNAVKGNVQIKVMDMNGKIYIFDDASDNKGNLRRNYQLGNLAKGIYLIQLISESGVSVSKLVLQ